MDFHSLFFYLISCAVNLVLHLENIVEFLFSQFSLFRVVKPLKKLQIVSHLISGNSLDGSVIDVGEQVGLLLLAVALPQQQLLHCRKRQAHHNLYYSEIVSHNTTKSIDKTSSEKKHFFISV